MKKPNKELIMILNSVSTVVLFFPSIYNFKCYYFSPDHFIRNPMFFSFTQNNIADDVFDKKFVKEHTKTQLKLKLLVKNNKA